VKVRYRDNEKMPFPTRPLKVQGGTVEEYVIPEAMKAEVLEHLCIFKPVPSLNEMRFDLHEEKLFCVRDFRVIWSRGFNWLVSPYFPSSGGTVIDWAPADWADDGPGFHFDATPLRSDGEGSGPGAYLITGRLP
jgi:hypothetical protein